MSMPRFGLALGLVLALAATLVADTCPGCGGTGRIGCGGCNAFPGVGICQKCTGNGSSYDTYEKRQKTCDRCHGTGKCAGCGGQGAACMVCGGSGQTQGGGAEPSEAPGGRPTGGLTPEQTKARIVEAVQQLGGIAGEWSGSGTEDGKSYQAQGRCVPCLDDAFIYLEWAVTYEDGRTSSSIDMLSYDPAKLVYTMDVFSSQGSVFRALGTPSEGGGRIDWRIVGNDAARFCWAWNGDTWESLVELNSGGGWKEFARERQVRAQGGGD